MPLFFGRKTVSHLTAFVVGIISDNQGYYIGWGELSSKPEVILISEGISLGDDLYEYKDARALIKINEIIEKKGKISRLMHWKLEKLREKYGLDVL